MNTFDADKKTCMLIYKCIIKRARTCIFKSSLSVCLSACVTVLFPIYESTIIVMYDLIKTVNILNSNMEAQELRLMFSSNYDK